MCDTLLTSINVTLYTCSRVFSNSQLLERQLYQFLHYKDKCYGLKSVHVLEVEILE